MPENVVIRKHTGVRRAPWQACAAIFCFLYGIAMIANNQLQGDGNWFWYAVLFHHGAKLYADLHYALQPLYILEVDLWIKCFGTRTLATEALSVVHLLFLLAGIAFALRESRWPDWQKAVVFLACLVLWVYGSSYRFDDYHVTTESFILFAIVALLRIANTESFRRQTALAAITGVLCGFILTSRLNDGAAELAAIMACLLVIPAARKLALVGTMVAAAALTFFCVIKATGDTFANYTANSIFRAASAKGGGHQLLADPFVQLWTAARASPGVGKTLLFAALVALAAIVSRFRTRRTVVLFTLQLCVAIPAFALSPKGPRDRFFFEGTLINPVVTIALLVNTLLSLAVATRLLLRRFAPAAVPGWDRREILVLIPLALWASISTSAAGNPYSSYYAQIPMLVLIAVALRAPQPRRPWIRASALAGLALLAVTGVCAKIRVPYSWNTQSLAPMFTGRVWYRNPVEGPMYLERGLLDMSRSICTDIRRNGDGTELLSLPMAYPNYFCGMTPWHGFVQTYYDTSTRASIEKLLAELATQPPKWIVYQRQMDQLTFFAAAYNHGEPLAQSELDALIIARLASGQWQLVDKLQYGTSEGWYLIRTRS